MTRYIKEDDLMALFDKYHPYMATKVLEFEKELKALPTVDAKSIKHGEWNRTERPTKDGRYLVTYHEFGPVGFDYDVYETRIMRLYLGYWNFPQAIPNWVDKVLKKEVVAWMELPAPYGREEHDQTD